MVDLKFLYHRNIHCLLGSFLVELHFLYDRNVFARMCTKLKMFEDGHLRRQVTQWPSGPSEVFGLFLCGCSLDVI